MKTVLGEILYHWPLIHHLLDVVTQQVQLETLPLQQPGHLVHLRISYFAASHIFSYISSRAAVREQTGLFVILKLSKSVHCSAFLKS